MALPPSDQISRRASILNRHLQEITSDNNSHALPSLERSICLHYSPPETTSKSVFEFDARDMRRLLDGHNLVDRDWLYGLMVQSELFCPKGSGGRVFVAPDYNQPMEQQREMTTKRIGYLLSHGAFEGWLTKRGPEAELRKQAFLECLGSYDHSLMVMLSVHISLWYGFY